MAEQPTLRTARLTLRPFDAADAPAVQRLAGDYRIADTTANIPHPYPDQAAAAWIDTHIQRYVDFVSVTYAVALHETGELIGAIGLVLSQANRRAEMGYWIGVPFWNHGYCTEAAAALLRFGFEELKLDRITAEHFSRNPASGRVMQKSGMVHEGRLRGHMVKWGKSEDVEVYGILRLDWEAAQRGAGDVP